MTASQTESEGERERSGRLSGKILFKLRTKLGHSLQPAPGDIARNVVSGYALKFHSSPFPNSTQLWSRVNLLRATTKACLSSRAEISVH